MTSRIENPFEEAFLKRYVSGQSAPQNLHATPTSDSKGGSGPLLTARCASDPGRVVKWSVEGERQSFVSGLLDGILLPSRSIELELVDGGADTTIAINGIVDRRQTYPHMVVGASDVFEVVSQRVGRFVWRIEGLASSALAPKQAATVVASRSPFVVAEAADNRTTFETVTQKVQMLQLRLKSFAIMCGVAAAEVDSTFKLASRVSDPPAITLVHVIDGCLNGLQVLEAEVTKRLKRPKKADAATETITNRLRVAALPSAVGSAHHAAVTSTGSSALKVQLAAAAHSVWVAREQVHQLTSRVSIESGVDLHGLMGELESALHRNAELERRLSRRDDRLQEALAENVKLSAAITPDRCRREVAVEQLLALLSERRSQYAAMQSSSEAGDNSGRGGAPVPPRALTPTEESRLWVSVADLLRYVEQLENTNRCLQRGAFHIAEDGRLESDRGCRERVCCSSQEYELESLRSKVANLESQGSVDVVVGLQRGMQELLAELGSSC